MTTPQPINVPELGGSTSEEALKECENWVLEYISQNQFGPSVRECGINWGVSHGTAHTIMLALEKRGVIKYAEVEGRKIPRAIS